MTSHAAVVARGWGKPCVCGMEALSLDGKNAHVGPHVIKEGDWISINGTTGEVGGGGVGVAGGAKGRGCEGACGCAAPPLPSSPGLPPLWCSLI